MTESLEQTEQFVQNSTEENSWQTPEYSVVETALEVTAYSLNAR